MIESATDLMMLQEIIHKLRNERELTATPETILNLTKENPIVNACFYHWRAGKCSWEEVLVLMVKELAMQNKSLQDKLIDVQMRMPTMISGSFFKDGKVV